MSEQLIEAVRQYKCIYDFYCKDYKDQSIKNDAWEAISKSLKTTASCCKLEWTKLRNNYLNALKRRRSKKSGQQGAKKEIPWRYEKEMSFLKPYLQNRSIHRNLEQASTSELLQEQVTEVLSEGSQTHHEPDEQGDARDRFDFSEDDEVDDIIEIDIGTEDLHNKCANAYMESSSSSSSDNSGGPGISQKPKAKRSSPRSDVEEMLAIMRENVNRRKIRDDNKDLKRRRTLSDDLDDKDLFFLSISKTVKALPVQQQAYIKMEICKLVGNAEIAAAYHS